MTPRMKLASLLVAGLALGGTVSDAFAKNRYTRTTDGYRHYGYRHRGIGAGPVVAGAALGILGAAVAGAQANRYYNGYPAYSYGTPYSYGGPYGYDYHPAYGYYGPY